MKKMLLLILLIGGINCCYSQIYFGAQGGLFYTKYKTIGQSSSNTFNWNVSPEIGYWIHKGSQVGASVNYSQYRVQGDKRNQQWSPTIHFRKWFEISNRVSLFGGLDIYYLHTTQYSRNFSTNEIISQTESIGYGGALNSGASFTFDSGLSIIGKINLLGIQHTQTDLNFFTNKQTSLVVNGNSSGPALNFGVMYTFSEKEE